MKIQGWFFNFLVGAKHFSATIFSELCHLRRFAFLLHTAWGELLSTNLHPRIQPWIPVRSYRRLNVLLSCANKTDRSWKPSITLCSSYCRRSWWLSDIIRDMTHQNYGLWLNPPLCSLPMEMEFVFAETTVDLERRNISKSWQGTPTPQRLNKKIEEVHLRHKNVWVQSRKAWNILALEATGELGWEMSQLKLQFRVLTSARSMTFRWYLNNLWKHGCSLSLQRTQLWELEYTALVFRKQPLTFLSGLCL